MDPAHRAGWQTASPYLDTALDLAPEERAAWLADLRARTPELADLVARWLAECDALEQHDFLGVAPPVEPLRASLAGAQLGAWRLVTPIGHGGMGTVWLAERTDGRFESRVAVKLLNAALVGRAGADRFAREGRILARLAHPQIAHLVDAGVSDLGQPYLVLEYVEGEPIDVYCDRRRLSVSERLHLLIALMAPVAHAHANLVVHRDLKPSNVLVTAESRVKLLDFGIARLLGADDAAAPLTRAGDALLTPAYAAPEQVTKGDVSTATDVYALGVLAYVVLTGRHPAASALDNPAALVHAITEVDPPRLSDTARDDDPPGVAAARAAARGTTVARLAQQLAGDLDTVVASALKKAPAERYGSVTAFADDLRRVLAHEPIAARADSAAYRMRKFVRRNRVAVALGTAASVAIVAGVAGTWTQAARAATERDFAMRQLARAESMNEMNTFLLSDAAPLGGSFTAGDLLARAEQLLMRRPADRPDENLVESLIAVGMQYRVQDEDDNARRVLTRAYALSRALPPASAATRGKAACALAGGLALGPEPARAQPMVAAGLAEIPEGPPFALDRVFCERQAALVARQIGDAGADIAHVVEADRLLRASGLGSDLAQLGMDMELAEAYRNAGRERDAAAAFAAAFAQMTALGRDRTERAGTLLNNWALTKIGRPREAEQLYRRAVEISRADGGEASVSPMLLTNLARELDELDRGPEAIALADRAAVEAARLGDALVHQQGLLVRVRAYRNAGQLDRAAALLDEFERTQRHRLPPGHVAFAAFEVEKGVLFALRGDLGSAHAALDLAEAIASALPQGPGPILIRAVMRRAEVNLAQAHLAAAESDAERAVAMQATSVPAGERSSTLGRVQATLGRVKHAAGKDAAARAALEQAVWHFTDALGPDHRETRAARDLLAALP